MNLFKTLIYTFTTMMADAFLRGSEPLNFVHQAAVHYVEPEPIGRLSCHSVYEIDHQLADVLRFNLTNQTFRNYTHLLTDVVNDTHHMSETNGDYVHDLLPFLNATVQSMFNMTGDELAREMAQVEYAANITWSLDRQHSNVTDGRYLLNRTYLMLYKQSCQNSNATYSLFYGTVYGTMVPQYSCEFSSNPFCNSICFMYNESWFPGTDPYDPESPFHGFEHCFTPRNFSTSEYANATMGMEYLQLENVYNQVKNDTLPVVPTVKTSLSGLDKDELKSATNLFDLITEKVHDSFPTSNPENYSYLVSSVNTDHLVNNIEFGVNNDTYDEFFDFLKIDASMKAEAYSRMEPLKYSEQDIVFLANTSQLDALDFVTTYFIMAGTNSGGSISFAYWYGDVDLVAKQPYCCNLQGGCVGIFCSCQIECEKNPHGPPPSGGSFPFGPYDTCWKTCDFTPSQILEVHQALDYAAAQKMIA